VTCFPAAALSGLGAGAAIAPDVFEAAPHSMAQLIEWAFAPAPDAQLAALIEKGRRDARSWVSASGVMAGGGAALPPPPRQSSILL
jgi:hypothetical protein